jgi:hypothetical protein
MGEGYAAHAGLAVLIAGPHRDMSFCANFITYKALFLSAL